VHGQDVLSLLLMGGIVKSMQWQKMHERNNMTDNGDLQQKEDMAVNGKIIAKLILLNILFVYAVKKEAG
jgi:hypothetical protein